MAFQIQDDILDEIGLSKNIGKNAKSDYRKSKMTYPHVHGMNAAKQKVKSLTNDAIKELSLISRDTTILEKVALFLLERDK